MLFDRVVFLVLNFTQTGLKTNVRAASSPETFGSARECDWGVIVANSPVMPLVRDFENTASVNWQKALA